MENCLVKKLKVSVNDTNLPRLGKIMLHLGVSTDNFIRWSDIATHNNQSDRINVLSGTISITSTSGGVTFNVTEEAYIELSDKYLFDFAELRAPENAEKFNGIDMLQLRLRNGGTGNVQDLVIQAGGTLMLMNTNCYGELSFDNNLNTINLSGSVGVKVKKLPASCDQLNNVSLICTKANLQQCVVKQFSYNSTSVNDLTNYTLDDLCVWSALNLFNMYNFGGGILTDKLAEAFDAGRTSGEISITINQSTNIKLKGTDTELMNGNYSATFSVSGVSVYKGSTLLTSYNGNTWS